MTVKLTEQTQRLSYTRRDIDLIDAEVDRFIVNFIPVIKNTTQANVGRLFLRIVEGLVDKLNYSLDMKFRQSMLRTVKDLQAAFDITELVHYHPSMVSAATVDMTVTAIGGAAPVGGISVPQYQVFLTETSPVRQFIALAAGSISVGGSSTTVSAVQGTRTVGQTLLAAALGEENETVIMPVPRTPVDYLEVQVDGVTFTRVEDFRESEPEDRHFYVKMDSDLYLHLVFGDDLYGVKLTPGAAVTGTYIQCDGEDGNTPAGVITKTTGSLAQVAYVNNEEKATGGSDGDTYEDVVRKAPLEAASMATAANTADFAALAQGVSGVHQALANVSDGTLVKIYILPSGGGIASSALLTLVEGTLQDVAIEGATVTAYALYSAHILISMRVVLRSSSINKSVARKKIYEAISDYKLDGTVNEDGALYYRNLTIGRGLALSDMASILESIDDGELVDYVDFLKFTRYPTAIPSNPAAPDFVGEILPGSTALYSEWKILVVTTSTFYVYKDGTLDVTTGQVGVEFTSENEEITFTLGQSGDVLVVGDIWTFKTSAYADNMYLDKYEFMELARDSDIELTIYYPNEYSVGS